jgi:carboxypeptidase Taq
MRAQQAYDELIRRAREEAVLASCTALLDWDELTYLPRAGVEHRARQMALLAGLQHDRTTDRRIGELLDELEHSTLVADPLAPAAVNIRELRRAYNRARRLPRSLVEELAQVTSLAQQAWAEALHTADFAYFLPWLEKVLVLKCQEAECLGYRTCSYDALLEEYEPGAQSREIACLFEGLRRDLVPLAQAITAIPRQPGPAILRRAFPVDRQRIFSEAVAAAIGFDFQGGRLDTTVHPFCTHIAPGDCRLAVRFHRHDLREGLFGILHEAGHGLYEQGLDPECFGTPMGEAVSVGVHESQARFWENNVGRSRAFWEHFFCFARQVFPNALHDVTLDQFHRAINHVEPTLTRVGADEVTYNLHILIRFELEEALMSGDLRPAEVPEAWAERYRKYLGLSPTNDAEGCLQDGHWGAGLVGYFPTYTLGNLFAAQLFAATDRDLGGLGQAFAAGRFEDLVDWLRVRVYRQGQRYPAARLIEQVTGSPPDHRPLIAALRRKYGELYGL